MEDVGFQLTPSRRATIISESINDISIISTHALTEGDFKFIVIDTTIFISTHALTEGDVSQLPEEWKMLAFQLTPSRRATLTLLSVNFLVCNFNSRPHGGRPSFPARSRCCRYFNSRPHGGRPFSGFFSPSAFAYFNSRPHGGRPVAPAAIATDVAEFQLTPSRRATRTRRSLPFRRSEFQLTPSRRATANLDKFFF